MWIVLSKKDLDRVKFKGGSVTTLPRTSAFATFSLEPIWNTHAPPRSQGSKKKKKKIGRNMPFRWSLCPFSLSAWESPAFIPFVQGRTSFKSYLCCLYLQFTPSRGWRITKKLTMPSTYVRLNGISEILLSCISWIRFLGVVRPSAVIVYSKYLNFRVFVHLFSHTYVYLKAEPEPCNSPKSVWLLIPRRKGISHREQGC